MRFLARVNALDMVHYVHINKLKHNLTNLTCVVMGM